LAAGAAAQPAGFTPVSIYPLDNGQAVDQLGHSQPGQVHGAIATADRNGVPNGALYFDGVDDYVQTNENSNFKPLTFSVWFKADGISGEHSIVDSDVGGHYGHSLIIGYDDPGNRNDTPRDGSLDVQYHNGFWDTGRRIEAGRWYQAFVTYGDEMKLYLDGVLVAQQPYSGSAFDGSTFRFGRHNDGDPQWFKGAIDDVRFYNQELSAEVIEEITESEGGGTTAAARPSRTPWKMSRAPVIDRALGISQGHSLESAFEGIGAPAESDPSWGPAPNPQTIGFESPSSIPREVCEMKAEYNHFYTIVDVPAGVDPAEFQLEVQGVDDAARVSIHHANNRDGTVVGYIRTNTTLNIGDHMRSGRNWVVVTQLDWCRVHNTLRHAEVKHGGQPVVLGR
jgi:hypothetical protein